MPNWLEPLLALVALVGFLGFAFYQGRNPRPDGDGNADHPDGGKGGDASGGRADAS